jgi:TPR repeat protein
MCRAVLPDPSTQFKQGMELFGELLVKVEKGETSWTALTLEEELRAKIMVSCLQGSADHGDENAMVALGWVTLCGSGVDANTELGISWLQEAANMGNANSCAALGCIARDSGNHKESLYWFKVAADQGNCEAQFWLGCAYTKGDGAPCDIVHRKEGLRLLSLAAASGHQEAIQFLGRLKHNVPT